MKKPLAKISHWLPSTAITAVLLLAGATGPAQASGWGPGSSSGPWNGGRHWSWQSDKGNDFFSWGTGESNNPWDKWGPWNQRQQYPWEEGWWDKLPWSGNRPWDRGGFDMPWSKKKARKERRKDYLEYLQDSRKQRLRRKLRYARPPYPPPYGYGYAPPRYVPPPAAIQGAPAPSAGMTPVPWVPGKANPAPRPAGEQARSPAAQATGQ